MFWRQLKETVSASTQILIIFVFLTLTFTTCFTAIAAANGKPFSSFWYCFILTHRFALGDFEILEEDNLVVDEDFIMLTEVIWIAYFFGSLVFVLVLINMVIAIMADAQARVTTKQYSELYRAKLSLVLESHHFLKED